MYMQAQKHPFFRTNSRVLSIYPPQTAGNASASRFLRTMFFAILSLLTSCSGNDGWVIDGETLAIFVRLISLHVRSTAYAPQFTENAVYKYLWSNYLYYIANYVIL
ncbi:hypothetical protein F5Y12DRAFT_711873 [Xylaria sp. FL1777]|nr:hypothetical protein F5Y12DRAFT_711873 [Xylaria sp. FL1777]